MSEEWENIVIETGVDTLLNYLGENQEAAVSEISEDIGVSKDRVKKWANALEDEGFIEKTYSARRGMILHYTKSSKENVDEKIEEIEKKVEEKTQEVEKEMERKGDEVKSAKKHLQEMAEELEENEEKEEEIKAELENLEEMEKNLQEKLEEHREREQELKTENVELLSRIENTINRVHEAEETAESFEDQKHEIMTQIKALRKLKDHKKKIDKVEDKLKNLEEKQDETKGIFKRFKAKVSGIFSDNTPEDPEQILNGNVDEVKKRISSSDLDSETLLEAEKKGSNRKTVKEYLVKQIDG